MLRHILWHSVPSIQFSPWTVLIEQFDLMYQSNRSFNIPSRATPPGIWIIGKFLFKFPPSPGRKAVQMPPPSGKLLDYCFNFSEASIMLLKLCMCKHGLLDNMPYMPQDSGHISCTCKHMKSTLSMNSAPLLYFTRSGHDHFNINWIHGRLYIVRFMQHLRNWWFNLLQRFFKVSP